MFTWFCHTASGLNLFLRGSTYSLISFFRLRLKRDGTRAKSNFVFRRNGRVHINRRGAGSVQSTTGNRGVRISGIDAGYTMFRCSVKSTGYSLHSAVSPSISLPCVTVYHHISNGLYLQRSLLGIYVAIPAIAPRV